jgi:PKD repeat protein
MRTQSIALALLVSLAFSLAAIAAPSFSDQDFDSGYVNPKDNVVVQKIKMVNGSSTITSVSIRNLGTADETDIKRIVIDDDNDPFTSPLKECTSLAGLRSGLHFSLDYAVPSGTSYLWIGVEIAGADKVSGGEEIQLRVRFYSGSYTTDYLTDGSPEEIFKGGFEEKKDDSPSASYLNPNDANVPVQKAIFTDNDGGDSDDTLQTGSKIRINKILVKNVQNATHDDVSKVEVRVKGKVGGTEYTYTHNKAPSAADWGSGTPLEFTKAELGLPDWFDDDEAVTVEILVSVAGTTDKHKIQTEMTLETQEKDGPYEQSIRASTTHTIRVQGFEAASDASPSIASGVLGPEETLVQKITLTDDDVNNANVTINGIWIKNEGNATKDDLKTIVVKKVDTDTTLFTLNSGDIVNFETTGNLYTTGFTSTTVTDDHSVTLAIEYTIDNTITDGHTLQPKVYIWTTENANDYESDQVTYPKSIVLHPHGLEEVTNISIANGTAYSGQRVLVQKIKCKDLDENDDSVRINPVRVKNIATNPCTESEVTKIEVRTEGGALLGEVTDLTGLNAGGVAISTLQNNVVADNSEVTLFIYVTFAGPEDVTAGHKLKLETTIFSEEDGHVGENSATGAEWTLAINHRPTCDFDYAPEENLSYDTEITFTAKDVNDVDGDGIAAHRWEFSDGGTGTGTSVKHTFAAGGTVWAKLTVEDARELTGSKTKTFDVEPPPVVPEAQFTWTPESPAVGEEVEFTDTSTTPTGTTITGWDWGFGDDETSDEQNPKHTYSAGGTYTVSLTVTNSDAQTDTVTHDIEVPALKPTADFDYSPTVLLSKPGKRYGYNCLSGS